MNFALANNSLAQLPLAQMCGECIVAIAMLGLIFIGGPVLIIWVLIKIVRAIVTPAGKGSPFDRTEQVVMTNYVKRANASGISNEEVTRRLSAAGWNDTTIQKWLK